MLDAAERSGVMIYDADDLDDVHVIQPWYVNLPGGDTLGVGVPGNFAFITMIQS